MRAAFGATIVPVVAGHGRNVELADAAFGLDLASHRRHRLGGRPHERESRGGHGPRECRPFGEKPIARVNGVGPHLERRGDDRAGVEVRLGGGRGADATRVVDELQVVRASVGVGVDAERDDSHRAGGARDPDGDLAAIGDEQSPDHSWNAALRRSRNARKPS